MDSIVARATLETLTECLNDRYYVQLAKVFTPDFGTAAPYMLVHRGTTISDVVVAVSVDQRETPVYVTEAYTSQAWGELGDAFIRLEAPNVWKAMRQVWQYVPREPTT